MHYLFIYLFIETFDSGARVCNIGLQFSLKAFQICPMSIPYIPEEGFIISGHSVLIFLLKSPFMQCQ